MVAPRDIGTATGTFAFVRQLSTSISVVVGGVIYSNQLHKHREALINSLGTSLAGTISGASAGASVEIIKDLPKAQREVAQAAFSSALRVMWIQYVCFAALGLFISLFVGKQTLTEEHTVTKTGLAEQEAQRLEIKEEKKRKNQEKLASARQSIGAEPMGTEEV